MSTAQRSRQAKTTSLVGGASKTGGGGGSGGRSPRFARYPRLSPTSHRQAGGIATKKSRPARGCLPKSKAPAVEPVHAGGVDIQEDRPAEARRRVRAHRPRPAGVGREAEIG